MDIKGFELTGKSLAEVLDTLEHFTKVSSSRTPNELRKELFADTLIKFHLLYGWEQSYWFELNEKKKNIFCRIRAGSDTKRFIGDKN